MERMEDVKFDVLFTEKFNFRDSLDKIPVLKNVSVGDLKGIDFHVDSYSQFPTIRDVTGQSLKGVNWKNFFTGSRKPKNIKVMDNQRRIFPFLEKCPRIFTIVLMF